MTPAIINKTFTTLLAKGSAGRKLRKSIGMSSGACCYLRWRLKHYNDVRLQTKINWLKKAGYDIGNAQAYTRAELVAFAKFTHQKPNRKGLALGFEYLADKWEAVNARRAMLKERK
jgi:hypothetical protein